MHLSDPSPSSTASVAPADRQDNPGLTKWQLADMFLWVGRASSQYISEFTLFAFGLHSEIYSRTPLRFYVHRIDRQVLEEGCPGEDFHARQVTKAHSFFRCDLLLKLIIPSK